MSTSLTVAMGAAAAAGAVRAAATITANIFVIALILFSLKV
jgi:hypothetical protein